MSKKRLLLASAILSVATLAASCGGGGGDGTASVTTTTPPPSTTTTPPPPTVGSLGTPAVFTRLSPAGAGQDRYYFVDGSGNKVEVTDLAGKDITTVLYQFNNANLLVRTATNQVFCVDVSNASAKDLGLTFAGHAYANVTNELVRNRPYFLMNATDGGYVITKDCNAQKVSSTQFAQIMVAQDVNAQKVFAINNTYAIVQDANVTNPSVFVVKADGTSQAVLSNASTPRLRIDNSATRPGGSYTTFLVGDDNAAAPIHLITDTGDPVFIFTSPLNAFGNKTLINKAPSGAYLVVLNSPEKTVGGQQVSCALTAFRVAGNMVTQFQVNGATFGCGALGIQIRVGQAVGSAISAFDLDANNNLIIGAFNASGASCGANISTAANFVAAINDFGVVQGTGYMGQGTATVFSVIGLNNGALTIGGLGSSIAYFQFAPNFTVRTLSNDLSAVVHTVGSLAGSVQTCSPNAFNTQSIGTAFINSLNNGGVRVKGTRTNNLLIGMLYAQVDVFDRTGAQTADGSNDNIVAGISFTVGGNPSCLVQGETCFHSAGTGGCFATGDGNPTDQYSNNLDRNVVGSFVVIGGATAPADVRLRDMSPTAPRVVKNNVVEGHFAGATCGGLGQLVQIYSPTDRACVNPVAGGFIYNYVNYNTDAVTPNTITGAGAGINAPTFGDVANNNNALFTYLDSAANRGTVSFCPSGNTWEYLILGNQNVQYPASGSQTVGLCFKVFNSFNGAGGVGNNNALGVPFIKF